MWIASSEKIREIDHEAIESYGLPARVLMEKAGEAAFSKLRQLIPAGSIAVVCGKGNNGGDGFVVARLAINAGYLVDVLITAPRSEVRGETLCALELALAHITFADSEFWTPKLQSLSAHDLVVDAILGTGIKGKVEGITADAIHAINRSGATVLSIDIPSGIDCDTGTSLGPSVIADATITFGFAKPFLFQNDGLEQSGDWSVADIGYPSHLTPAHQGSSLLEASWVADRLPIRDLDSNKGRNGHVLIVAGSDDMPGAATLAATAALRAGAGLVTVASTESVCRIVAAHLPEVLLLPITHDEAGATKLLERSKKADAGLFGPGIGHDEATDAFLSNVFAAWDRPALVDADALNAVSRGVDLPPGPCVLTPHPGEAGRLLDLKTTEVQHDRFAAVEKLVGKTKKSVLLKGRYSLVFDASLEGSLVNPTGNSGMAAGGSGDTLSGIIATLLAQGLAPIDAAACGMYWHGAAADRCAETIGTVGYLPTDISQALPNTRDTILQQCEP